MPAITPISDSDQAFLRKLYEDNINFMFYIARQYAADRHSADDIVQETTVRLIKNISVLRKIPCCNLKRYIVLTIRTVFLDLEKKKRHDVVLSLDDEKLEALLRKELLVEAEDPAVMARLEVWRLEQELSARDWALLKGKYLQSLSDEALGQALGVSPASVRMLLTRARKNAKTILLRGAGKGGGASE